MKLLKIITLFSFVVVISTTTVSPTTTHYTLPPVNVPNFTQCTQFENSRENYWFTFPGSQYCYLFSNYNSLGPLSLTSWHNAFDICRNKKSTLASIHSFDTNYIMSHPLVMPNGSNFGYYWLGLNSLNSNPVGNYKWIDGTPRDFNADWSNTTHIGEALDKNVLNQGKCISMMIVGQKDRMYNYYESKIGLWYKTDCNDNQHFICERSIDPKATPPPPPQPTPGGCPDGWYKYGGEKCVKYLDKIGNYSQAQNACAQLAPGAGMLSIHSQEEQDFITTLTYGLSSPYIGIIRYHYGSPYTWEDQSRINYNNYAIQDGADYQLYWHNCATLITKDTQTGKWLRTRCNENHTVICQIPFQDPKLTTGLTLDNKCKISGFGDYEQFRNSCYLAIETEAVFAAAEQTCNKSGAHLVSVVDGAEDSFIRYYLSQKGNKTSQYWIGLHEQESSLLEWTDNWPVYYTNWKMNHREGGCATMDMLTGRWDRSECNASLPFMCKVSQDKPPELIGNRNGHCPRINHQDDDVNYDDDLLDWVDLHRALPHCYWLSTERAGGYLYQRLAYADASFHCRRRNGTLVSIHSTPEHKLLINRLSNDVPNFEAWIGLQTNPSGQVVWDDGSRLDFTNGLNTEPVRNSTDLNDDSWLSCAQMKYDGTWKWDWCHTEDKHFFVCQTSKVYHDSLIN